MGTKKQSILLKVQQNKPSPDDIILDESHMLPAFSLFENCTKYYQRDNRQSNLMGSIDTDRGALSVYNISTYFKSLVKKRQSGFEHSCLET